LNLIRCCFGYSKPIAVTIAKSATKEVDSALGFLTKKIRNFYGKKDQTTTK